MKNIFFQIISSRRSWAVQSAALTLRCELERRSNRKVERACQQAEALKNANSYFGKEVDFPSFSYFSRPYELRLNKTWLLFRWLF